MIDLKFFEFVMDAGERRFFLFGFGKAINLFILSI